MSFVWRSFLDLSLRFLMTVLLVHTHVHSIDLIISYSVVLGSDLKDPLIDACIVVALQESI